MRPSKEDKSAGRQAKPQSLAVWWLLKQITAPGPRPRSSTNDLAPPLCMGWVVAALPGRFSSPARKGPRLPVARPPAAAEIGRAEDILASRSRGTEAIVACLGGILA